MIHFVDESKSLTVQRRIDAAGERARRSHVTKTVRRREREEYTAGIGDVDSIRASHGDDAWKTHRTRKAHMRRGQRNNKVLPSLSKDLFEQGVPSSPTIWYTDSNHFQSPILLSQMFALCADWAAWISGDFRQSILVERRDILDRAWNISASPMCLGALVLVSIGHIDAVNPGTSCGAFMIHKARLLRELRHRLVSTKTAISDYTLHALLLLTSFELSHANREAVTHLHGIRTLLCLRTRNGTLLEVPLFLETLDLIQTILFDSSPIFATLQLDRLDIAGDFDRVDGGLLQLLVHSKSTDFDCVESSMRHITIIRDLKSLVTTSAACLKGAVYRELSAEEEMSLHNSLHQFGLHGNSTKPDCLSQVARACHQSFAVLHNVLVNGHGFKHKSNMQYVLGAFSAMKLVDERSWQNMPFLTMWIMLVGMSACHDSTVRAYLGAHLHKVVYHTAISELQRVRDFFSGFLKIRKFLNSRSGNLDPVIDLNENGIITHGHVEHMQDDAAARSLAEDRAFYTSVFSSSGLGNVWSSAMS